MDEPYVPGPGHRIKAGFDSTKVNPDYHFHLTSFQYIYNCNSLEHSKWSLNPHTQKRNKLAQRRTYTIGTLRRMSKRTLHQTFTPNNSIYITRKRYGISLEHFNIKAAHLIDKLDQSFRYKSGEFK